MLSKLAPTLTKLYARATRSASITDPEAVTALADRWTATTFPNRLFWSQQWMGMTILQQANDLMILQEIIHHTRPRVIVETGTFGGGSAIFYASMLSILGGGRVISVDVEHSAATRDAIALHPLGAYVTLITGDSIAPDTIGRVMAQVGDERDVMVALDSNHQYHHVLAELRAYADLVPPGGYIVAFDTVCEQLEGLPFYKFDRGDNPARAVAEFLRERDNFAVDRECDRLMVSYCKGGYLRRLH
jgi:cephalosporin hydroxylase